MSGVAISFCDADERAYLKDINKLINTQIPVNNDHPFNMNEKEFAGTETISKKPPVMGQNNFRHRHFSGMAPKGKRNGSQDNSVLTGKSKSQIVFWKKREKFILFIFL